MAEDIAGRLRANLARVDRLVEFYKSQGGSGKGRRAVETSDLLRAAVVFLHATMEDVLRTVQSKRWPGTSSREHLEKIEIAVSADDTREKITLGDLLVHRGKSIDDLIRESVLAHLERSNFNNLADVKKALARSGIDPVVVTPFTQSLAAMMSRRHLIVHRADR